MRTRHAWTPGDGDDTDEPQTLPIPDHVRAVAVGSDDTLYAVVHTGERGLFLWRNEGRATHVQAADSGHRWLPLEDDGDHDDHPTVLSPMHAVTRGPATNISNIAVGADGTVYTTHWDIAFRVW